MLKLSYERAKLLVFSCEYYYFYLKAALTRAVYFGVQLYRIMNNFYQVSVFDAMHVLFHLTEMFICITRVCASNACSHYHKFTVAGNKIYLKNNSFFQGFDLKEQRYVAVKIHHLNREWNEQKKLDYARHANREAEIHRRVNHPRIVSLYDRFEVDINT